MLTLIGKFSKKEIVVDEKILKMLAENYYKIAPYEMRKHTSMSAVVKIVDAIDEIASMERNATMRDERISEKGYNGSRTKPYQYPIETFSVDPNNIDED